MKWELPDELKFITNSRLPQKVSAESMEGKTCVITGSTSGVGYQAALSLAKRGAQIISVVRNVEKAKVLCNELNEINGQDHSYFIADFEDLQEVRTVTERMMVQFEKVDVLINNAGLHNTTRQLTKDGHEKVFCVNHLASFLITVLFVGKMKENTPARIIQVNSEGHRFNGLRIDDLDWSKRSYGGLKGYGASKTAQLMTVWEMAEILKGSGITINAMHPGAVKSNIGTNNGRLYNWYSKYIIQPMLKDPVISGEALYYLASTPDMEQVSGKFFNLTHEEIPARHARNRVLGKQIFELSLKMTGLDEKYLR